MKKSELRNIISEEIQKIISESTIIKPVSKITFDEVQGLSLPQPYDNSLATIYSERNLKELQRDWIKSKFGDVKFKIDKSESKWFDRAKVMDKKYQKYSSDMVKGIGDFYKKLDYKGD